MNQEQRWRLDAMLEPASLGRYDLNDFERGCIRAAMEPDAKMRRALEAVLLFHSGSPWTTEKQLAWLKIVGHESANTKILCDHIRAVLELTQ